jgi:hypothetical protein
MGSCLSKRNLKRALHIIQTSAHILDLQSLELAAAALDAAIIVSRAASRSQSEASRNPSPTQATAL